MPKPNPTQVSRSTLNQKVEQLLKQLENHQSLVDKELRSLHKPKWASQRLASFLLNLPDPTLQAWDPRSLHSFRLQIQDLEHLLRNGGGGMDTSRAQTSVNPLPSPRWEGWNAHS